MLYINLYAYFIKGFSFCLLQMIHKKFFYKNLFLRGIYEYFRISSSLYFATRTHLQSKYKNNRLSRKIYIYKKVCIHFKLTLLHLFEHFLSITLNVICINHIILFFNSTKVSSNQFFLNGSV